MKQKQRLLQEVAKEILKRYKEHEEKFIEMTSESAEEKAERLGFMDVDVGMYSNEIERASALEAPKRGKWEYGEKSDIDDAPTVDAIPVEFIEKQIESAEWILTHIGNSDYYGNTCEELSLKCYILRSLINKWRDE